jgi:dihydrofolate synthase/folylpolyglutamate synthase
MRRLLDLLGAPDRRYPAVIVAGTKGKGSTAAILASILRAAGLRVGLYSQPHLQDYRERVRIDGVPFSEADLVAGVERLQPAVARLADSPELGPFSTYDLGTALAIDHFGAAGVDIAVLEIGLGGRYDTVNTVTPLVSIITAISLDHIAVLGDTIEQIASEKAGIIKPGVPVVAQRQRPAAAAVIERIAAEQGAPLHWADDLVAVAPVPDAVDPFAGAQTITLESSRPPFAHGAALVATLPLLGHFQLANAAAALGAALLLMDGGQIALSLDAIAAGLATARWPGRLEIVRREPLTIVDGAHNADSAAQLRRALGELFPWRPITLILGTSLDKDLSGIAAALVPVASQLILTASSHPRSASLERLHRATDPYAIPTSDTTAIPAALARAAALTPPGGLILATGSLFIVADVRAALGLDDAVRV